MYLYITSKSAKADKIGDSALRDNCVTSYVFKTKPQNAKTFYADKEKEQLVKELREPGEAVFTNIKDDSMLVKVPYAQPEDMLRVCKLLTDGNTIRISGPQPPAPPIGTRPIRVEPDPGLDSFFDTLDASPPHRDAETIDATHHTSDVIELDSRRHEQPAKPESYTVTTEQAPDSLPAPELMLSLLRANCTASEQTKTDWTKAFAGRAGISESLLKLILLEKRNITEETTRKVLPHLTASV